MQQKKKPSVKMRFTGLNRIVRSSSIQMLLDKVDDGTFRDFWQDWKWIFSFSKKYKLVIALYTLLGVGSTTLGLVSSVVSKYMIDIVTGYKYDKLISLGLIMLFSTVLSLVFSSVVNRFSLKLSIYVNNDIQAEIFDKIIDADWIRLREYANGDLLNRFNNDVGTVAKNAVKWLPDLVITIYNFVATLVVILYYDATMAVIAMLSTPFLLFSSRYLIRRSRQYQEKVMRLNSEKMSFETETFYNVDTIKSFGITEYYSKELRKWQERYKDYNLDYNMFSIRTNIALSILNSSISFLSFGYCLYRLWTGAITYGTMTLFLSQRNKFSSSFDSLVSIIPGMLNSAVSAHRIRELVELPREVHHPEGAKLMEKSRKDGFSVEMRDVDYSYDSDTRVLRKGNFYAKPNEIVALIGDSGGGKTTMLRMFLGLIRPDKGKVVLSDSKGHELEMNADIRKFFSYVPQGNTIMSGTIAQNMRMVKEDATDEEIIEALKIACAWEFVSRIPKGINGKLGEKGKGISEGQAQRIAIARAVLRNSPILLLDEATSALDVNTERQVLHNIIKQRPNKTCIVSTHRPSVLSMCNRIYQVTENAVVELNEEQREELCKEMEDFNGS